MSSHEDALSKEIEGFVEKTLDNYAHKFGLEPFGSYLTSHLADELEIEYGADILRGRHGERD